MLAIGNTKPKTWLQGLIKGEQILKEFMEEHKQTPSRCDMSAKLTFIFRNYCNSFSQEKEYNEGVMDYIENYIKPEFKELFDSKEVYIP